MKFLLLITLCLVWFSSIPCAIAQQSCSDRAYIIDEDPKGTNVRSRPDRLSEVIHVISYDENGTIVNLSGSNDGWIKINGYENMDGVISKKVTGWISARLLGTTHRAFGRFLYEAPSKSSKALALPPLNDWLNFRLLGCKGDWIQVETRFPSPEFVRKISGKMYYEKGKTEFMQMLLKRKTPLVGWLPDEAHCPNPVTTCP